MNMTSAWLRARLTPLAFRMLALVVSAGILAFGARSSAAQTADTDADSYADDLEVQLGSSPTNPDSTPENFALLWTCTDGNDNDKDGKRDFIDPGCRNTVPGSTPAPTAPPTPAPTHPPANSGGGSSGGGSGGGGSSDSGGGSNGGGSGGGGSSDDNAVLGGSGAPIGGGTSDGGGSGAGAASDTGVGDGSGAGTDATASDANSTDDAGATGAGDQSTSEGSGDDGFPWMISLLILLGGLAAAAICWALLGRSRARSRQGGTSARF